LSTLARVIRKEIFMRVLGQHVAVWCAFIIEAAVARPAASAQIVDRVRKSAKTTMDSATGAARRESRAQFNAASQSLASAAIADGAFSIVASPWSSDDASKRTELTRFSGTAVASNANGSYTITLCGDNASNRLTVTMSVNAAKASSPVATGASYTLPSPSVTITVTGPGVTPGTAGAGTLKLATVADNSVAGAARIRFPQAHIAGSTTAESADLGISFKARVMKSAAGAGSGCAAAPQVAAAPTASPTLNTAAAPPTAPSVAAAPSTAGAFAQGDVLVPKIEGIKLLADSKDGAAVSATLKKTDELVALGDERNGFVHVQGAAAEGWVKKVLVAKR
jgi:hypothetical protein